MNLLSAEAQRVAAREYLHWGQSSPSDRLTRYLASNQRAYGNLDDDSLDDDSLDDESPCQWEAMLQRLPLNRRMKESAQ